MTLSIFAACRAILRSDLSFSHVVPGAGFRTAPTHHV